MDGHDEVWQQQAMWESSLTLDTSCFQADVIKSRKPEQRVLLLSLLSLYIVLSLYFGETPELCQKDQIIYFKKLMT